MVIGGVFEAAEVEMLRQAPAGSRFACTVANFWPQKPAKLDFMRGDAEEQAQYTSCKRHCGHYPCLKSEEQVVEN